MTYEAIKEILPYLSKSGSVSCDYTIGGIYMWIDYFKYHYCIYEDSLFIKGVMEDDTSKVAFSLPLGEMPVRQSVELLREYCRCSGDILEFSAIPEERINEFLDLAPRSVSELSHWFDYVYDASAMATYSGKKLSKKRNHVNRFKSLFPNAAVSEIDESNINAVKKCFEEICSEPADSPMAEYERSKVWHVLDNMVCYGFESLCLTVDGEVAAFTLGEVINDTLHDHIEKALRRFEGSGETVFKEFAAHALQKYPSLKYVNREDDAGDEGLRQSKMSYHPALLLKKYNVVF